MRFMTSSRRSPVTAWLDGVSMIEEVKKTLHQLTRTLAGLQGRHGMLSLSVFYHDPDREQVISTEVCFPSDTTGTPHRVLHTPC